jgi:hypothetical protein
MSDRDFKDEEFEDFEFDKVIPGTTIRAQVTKVGGGSVGRRYHGRWIVRLRADKVTRARGSQYLLEADDLVTPASHPVSHMGAARIAAAFLAEE